MTNHTRKVILYLSLPRKRYLHAFPARHSVQNIYKRARASVCVYVGTEMNGGSSLDRKIVRFCDSIRARARENSFVPKARAKEPGIFFES